MQPVNLVGKVDYFYDDFQVFSIRSEQAPTVLFAEKRFQFWEFPQVLFHAIYDSTSFCPQVTSFSSIFVEMSCPNDQIKYTVEAIVDHVSWNSLEDSDGISLRRDVERRIMFSS